MEPTLKEFEKHFSFRLNKFLNFSDICFSHHSALHTDPDKINTFHLVGESHPATAGSGGKNILT